MLDGEPGGGGSPRLGFGEPVTLTRGEPYQLWVQPLQIGKDFILAGTGLRSSQPYAIIEFGGRLDEVSVEKGDLLTAVGKFIEYRVVQTALGTPERYPVFLVMALRNVHKQQVYTFAQNVGPMEPERAAQRAAQRDALSARRVAESNKQAEDQRYWDERRKREDAAEAERVRRQAAAAERVEQADAAERVRQQAERARQVAEQVAGEERIRQRAERSNAAERIRQRAEQRR